MIAREPETASDRAHDLIIIGGGIQGATLSFEAALRGYRPLLLEKDDFGGATSWNSLRIVHGGLRYLQSLDLARFRESVGERAWYLRDFPGLVEPLPCLMPLYGQGLHRPAVLRAALQVTDWLDRERNAGLLPAQRLPRGRVLSPDQTRELAPMARSRGLLGGALWHDATMTEAPRLLIELLHRACSAGATCLNYVEVVRPVREGARLAGVIGRDRATDEELDFRAQVVVNCSGPVTERVVRTLGGEMAGIFAPSVAFNLLFARDWPDNPALAVKTRRGSGRTYFLRTLGGRLLGGTFHAQRPADAVEPEPRDEEIAEFVADLNSALPGLQLVEDEIRQVFAGLLPARRVGAVELAKRPALIDHAASGGPAGLFTIAGVKYTTARSVSERMLRKIYGRRLRARLDRRGSGASGSEDAGGDRPEPTAPRPSLDYHEFTASWEDDRSLTESVVSEIVKQESVLSVDDLIFRRTDWAASRPEAVPELRRLLSHAVPGSVRLGPAR